MKRNCLIVGSQSSLGNEIKNIFLKNNYQVFGTSRKFKKFNENNNIFLDYGNNESLNTIAEEIDFLDAIVFCTGLLKSKEFIDYDDSEILEVFQANIIGPIKLLKRIFHKFNPECKIVFIGSIAGSAGSFDEVYASSKSAISAFVKSLAKKSKNNIRCNCISPGLIENSSMFGQFSKENIKSHKNQTPTNELNQLNKIAKVCFDICQDNWTQLNGQVIDINGGRYV